MRLHLGMDETGDIALMATQHLAGVILAQIGQKMLHGLSGQIVEHIGMSVVGHIIEVHQAADHIIFQPRLFETATAQGNHIPLVCAQMLNPQLIGHRRVM